MFVGTGEDVTGAHWKQRHTPERYFSTGSRILKAIFAHKQTKETKSLLAFHPCPLNSSEFMLIYIKRKCCVLFCSDFFPDSLIPVAEPLLEHWNQCIVKFNELLLLRFRLPTPVFSAYDLFSLAFRTYRASVNSCSVSYTSWPNLVVFHCSRKSLQ